MTKSLPLQALCSDQTSGDLSIDIAVVEPVGGYGGMDFYNHRLCQSLTDAGCRVILYTSSGYTSDPTGYGVVESFLGVFGREAKWLRALRFVSAIFKTLTSARGQGSKLAHFHIFHVGLLQYMSILMARAMGLRVVVTAHDVGSFRLGERASLLGKLYSHCAAVIAHSQTAKNTLIKDIGVIAQKVHHIPHGNYVGLLSEFPDKVSARAQLGISSDDFVVLFFGQCKRVKRLDLLIEAMACAREQNASRLKLLVAGAVTDADGEELTSQMQHKLGDAAIHHACYISNEQLPIYFAAADIVALPYDQIFQSGVVLLAMTYGVPVLTSDIDGMVEIVKNEHTGLTFCAGDVEDLTQRLIEIERGEWPLSEYACAARSSVLTNHDWDRCGQMTAIVYRQVLDVEKSSLKS